MNVLTCLFKLLAKSNVRIACTSTISHAGACCNSQQTEAMPAGNIETAADAIRVGRKIFVGGVFSRFNFPSFEEL